MKNLIILISLFLTTSLFSQEAYQVGDIAADFRLKNIDNQHYSLADIEGVKGYVLIFTCNHCPYSIAYEDRIIDLHKKYARKGYPVVLVNPNDSLVAPADSWSAMKIRAKEKNFPFLYLLDEKQEVYPRYGATRTPHVFLLNKQADASLKVAYIGAIDDNYKDVKAVTQPYLANAIDAILKGSTPEPSFTKAIGCSIKAAAKE